MTPRPYRYLITDAGDARVAIVHAPGGERRALLREHGEGAVIEETADGWSVRVDAVQTTYRAYSGEAGHEAVDLLSKTGHSVEVRLDYFMERQRAPSMA